MSEDKLQQDIERMNLAIEDGLKPILAAFEQLGLAIQASITAFAPIFTSLNDVVFKEIMRLRFDDETIIEYLERNPDMIDNPDVRWEYQCYIWQTPIRILRTLYKNKRAK